MVSEAEEEAPATFARESGAELRDRAGAMLSGALTEIRRLLERLETIGDPAAYEIEAEHAAAQWAASYVVRSFLPIDALCLTLRHAILDDLRDSQRGYQGADSIADDDRPLRLATPDDETAAGNDPPWYTLTPGLEEMLTWLARHRPSSAGHVISDVIGEAERNLGVPRHVTARTPGLRKSRAGSSAQH